MATAQQNESREGWIRVFCPDTRKLSARETAGIPPEKKKKAEAGYDGVWLEVKCPEEKCLTGEDEIRIKVRGVEHGRKEGLWHKIFCPEDRCMAQSPLDLP
ncbi:MAG: hypothetical protein ABFD62_12310 [Syntrophaceae bacterium]